MMGTSAACYSTEELLAIGFRSVGKNARVSRDARFFEISGSLGDNVRIDAFTVITGNIRVGTGVHISPFCFLGGTGGEISMEDHSGLSSHVSLFTKSDDYSGAGTGGGKITGGIRVGQRTVVGSGSTILPGVVIGENAKIGCACVVSHNIDAGTIVVSRGIGLVPLSRGQ